MANTGSDWLLKVIELEEESMPGQSSLLGTGGMPRYGYRGEILYKGETMYILDADSEEELESKAMSLLYIARRQITDPDDEVGLISYTPLL